MIFLERVDFGAPVGVGHLSFADILVSLGLEALEYPLMPVAWFSMPDLTPQMVQPAMPGNQAANIPLLSWS